MGKNIPQDLNQEQVRNIIKYIAVHIDKDAKETIFAQLGHECFYSRHLDRWIDEFNGNIQSFLDRINIEHKSRYWESLVFSPDKTRLILTGKIVNGCACPFADCSEPPVALCFHCCKSFQQEIFGRLSGRKVTVEITESFLLGNQRCNTIIHFPE